MVFRFSRVRPSEELVSPFEMYQEECGGGLCTHTCTHNSRLLRCGFGERGKEKWDENI